MGQGAAHMEMAEQTRRHLYLPQKPDSNNKSETRSYEDKPKGDAPLVRKELAKSR